MDNVLLWITLLLMAADWIAVALNKERAHWVTKPGSLIALILWFSVAGKWVGPLALIGTGLVFSLAGDVILLFSRRYFLLGMVAFLVAHIFYIAGFVQPAPVVQWGSLVAFVIVTAGFAFLNKLVRKRFNRSSDNDLLFPITAYGLILSLMWLSALNTLFIPGWLLSSALLVALGGSLFYLSDSLLVNHKFIRRMRFGNLLVMVTYHLAQIFIAAGSLKHFLS